MSKAIYIGACLDIEPIILYKNIKNWILVDSMPMSEFGIDRRKGFSRPYFVPELLNIMENNNFSIINQEKDKYYIFENDETKQKIKYHINCAIPEEYYKIEDDIKNWNTLVVAGFNPDRIILQDCCKKKDLRFIGNSNTCYVLEENEEDTIMYYLHNKKNQKKFKHYDMIKNNKIKNLKNFYDLIK
jgi:hypothetical protein